MGRALETLEVLRADGHPPALALQGLYVNIARRMIEMRGGKFDQFSQAEILANELADFWEVKYGRATWTKLRLFAAGIDEATPSLCRTLKLLEPSIN